MWCLCVELQLHNGWYDTAQRLFRFRNRAYYLAHETNLKWVEIRWIICRAILSNLARIQKKNGIRNEMKGNVWNQIASKHTTNKKYLSANKIFTRAERKWKYVAVGKKLQQNSRNTAWNSITAAVLEYKRQQQSTTDPIIRTLYTIFQMFF